MFLRNKGIQGFIRIFPFFAENKIAQMTLFVNVQAGLIAWLEMFNKPNQCQIYYSASCERASSYLDPSSLFLANLWHYRYYNHFEASGKLNSFSSGFLDIVH